MFVGDAVWDVEAAKAAGVRCIAVCSGGVARSDLLAAGADQTYDSVQDLLSDYDSSLLAATPESSSV